MSDMESRVYGLEVMTTEDRTHLYSVIEQVSMKADKWEFDELRSDYHQRICYLEDKLYKVMKFLEQTWGITNVDDLI